jgi:betaine reductase
MCEPIVKGFSYLLFHTPDLVRYGSKPSREIAQDDSLMHQITPLLRRFEEAVAYPPNQVFVGNVKPDALTHIPQPWYEHPVEGAVREGTFGDLVPEEEFYGLLKIADDFDLVWLAEDFIPLLREKLALNGFFSEQDMKRLGEGHPQSAIRRRVEKEASLPLYYESEVVGCFNRHHEEDETLSAKILMENLATKASAGMALRHLLSKTGVPPGEIRYLLSCSEEAVGDRYNRGGGNLAKAIGEMGDCVNATGSDVKAFCSAPVFALVHAASFVKSGLFDNVVVVGGGSLPKLGMKFRGHLAHRMPILEDMLGSMAFLVARDDGVNPIIRLDSVGIHTIGSSSSQQSIMESLVVKPLQRVGLELSEVDKFSTELHNPEITLPQGSGNVPLNNYRMIAALAVLQREIPRDGLDAFVRKHGMPGFSPTQGHIPAAVPYLGHAIEAMKAGQIKRAMFLAKGSLFLGRMSQLSDGISFLLERNSRTPDMKDNGRSLM